MSSAVSQQMDVRSVGSCVSAVIAAYHDASKLLQRIPQSQDASATESPAKTALMTDLSDSLMLGPPIVQGQYEENLARLGQVYAQGDQDAREALKDVVISLQLSLLATLRMALLDGLELDFAQLQRSSDDGRLAALLCLFHLGQRMSVPRSPRKTDSLPSSLQHQSVELAQPEGRDRGEPSGRLAELQGSDARDSSSVYSVPSSVSSRGMERGRAEQMARAEGTENPRFSRTPSSRSSQPPHPGARQDGHLTVSPPPTANATTFKSPIFKWKPFSRSGMLTEQQPPSAPLPPSKAPDVYLPSADNEYAGFCKGAWRLQNAMKNSFRIDNRPVGMYMLQSSWNCYKCAFEGIVQESKFSGKAPVLSSMLGPVKTSIIQGMRVLQMFDQTVYLHGPSGNRYRWIFLAKAHVEVRPGKAAEKPVSGYGCIFCCSQNSGPAPVFGNLDTFMEHLREHGGRGYAWDRKKPSQQLLDHTRCILGRVADDSEDFDINIPTVAEIGG